VGFSGTWNGHSSLNHRTSISTLALLRLIRQVIVKLPDIQAGSANRRGFEFFWLSPAML